MQNLQDTECKTKTLFITETRIIIKSLTYRWRYVAGIEDPLLPSSNDRIPSMRHVRIDVEYATTLLRSDDEPAVIGTSFTEKSKQVSIWVECRVEERRHGEVIPQALVGGEVSFKKVQRHLILALFRVEKVLAHGEAGGVRGHGRGRSEELVSADIREVLVSPLA